MTYTLYGGKKNRGLRILWLLEELKLSYEVIDLDLFAGEQRSVEFLSLNPSGKVPTLIDHGAREERSDDMSSDDMSSDDMSSDDIPSSSPFFVVNESIAIINYLVEKHREHRLIPDDLKERARYHQWMFFAATELEAPIWVYQKHSFVYRADRRIKEIKPTCVFEFTRATRLIADTLKGKLNTQGRDLLKQAQEADRLLQPQPFLLGDHFSAVDLLIGQILMWGQLLNMPFSDPIIHEYVERLSARPAFLRAMKSGETTQTAEDKTP